MTAEVVLLKWLLIGRARAGRYPVHGWFYVRNWVVEQLLAFSVDVAGPLHATIFLKPWYRALGAKLGRFVEVSTASTTTPDLLDIDDDCTIADEVSLGAARVERGWLTLAPTRLGRRTFVGNGAVIPAGTTLGAESLVGVLTVAPSDPEQAAREAPCWLGSPPILLPRRQPCAGFPGANHISAHAEAAMGARVLGDPPDHAARRRIHHRHGRRPRHGAEAVGADRGRGRRCLLLPAVFAACCAAVILAVVPSSGLWWGGTGLFEKPLWSAFLWRLEFVNALFEFLATPIGLEALRGTPLLPVVPAVARLPDRTRRLHRYDRLP